MKKWMKKFSGLLAVGTLGSALVANIPSVSAQEEINVWAWDPNFNIKALNIAAEYYAKENPDLK